MTLARVGYVLCIAILIAVVLIAWTAIPDCDTPRVCGL